MAQVKKTAKKKTHPRKKLVLVEWGDAWSEHGWSDKDKASDCAPLLVSSVGWLLQATDDGVTLASRMTEDNSCGQIHFVPAGMIKRVLYIKAGDLVATP